MLPTISNLNQMVNSSITDSISCDIHLTSPYNNIDTIEEDQDLLIILPTSNPTPHTSSISFSGHVRIKTNEEITVKQVSLNLIGRYKLQFMQMGTYKDGSDNIASSLVKEQRIIFDYGWDNLLLSPQGAILIGINNEEVGDNNDKRNNLNGLKNGFGLNKFTMVAPNAMNKLIKKRKRGKTIVYETENNNNNINIVENVDDESECIYSLGEGEYDIPFELELPQDISETIEGLQSGSILYSFKVAIEGRATNKKKIRIKKYKYLRILKRLAMNDPSNQQVVVGNKLQDSLEYLIKLDSGNIPIGGKCNIIIELEPFQKDILLERVCASFTQYYTIRDNNGITYDDESVIFEETLDEFKQVQNIQYENNRLLGHVKFPWAIKLSENLKKVTPDCDVEKALIRVRHQLSIEIVIKRKIQVKQISDSRNSKEEYKSVRIRVRVPLRCFVSPEMAVQGRLILMDQTDGEIHFRGGQVSLFKDFHTGLRRTVEGTTPNSNPPNYNERARDQLLFSGEDVSVNSISGPQRTGIPTYDEAIRP